MAAGDGRKELEQAYDRLEQELPDRVRGLVRWVRHPNSRWVRLPLGVLFIAASFFWFLPVVGIEWLPLGLMLIAQDVPILRKPVARGMLWLLDKWKAIRKRREDGGA